MKRLQYGGRRRITAKQRDPMLIPMDRRTYHVQAYDKKTGRVEGIFNFRTRLNRLDAERVASDLYLARKKKVGVRIVPESVQ